MDSSLGNSARPAVVFEYAGRFGHFLRAEASVSALSYPVPPRTALLGMIGAVLGLEKDTPQLELRDALVAVSGPVPKTHWHRAKFRKDPPAALPQKVRKGAKGTSTGERATLIKQEWLFEPRYTVTACLSEAHHEEFAARVRERRWYYSPCMGLSEMTARLEPLGEGIATALPAGSEVSCSSVARKEGTILDGRRAVAASGNGELLAILSQRMPRAVTEDRIFTHEDYLIERSGLSIPLQADDAYEISTGDPRVDGTVIFL